MGREELASWDTLSHAAAPTHVPPGCQHPGRAAMRKGMGCRDSRAGKGKGPLGACWNTGEKRGREFASSSTRPSKTGSFGINPVVFHSLKRNEYKYCTTANIN